jgi:hypothetical protein
MVYTSHLVGQPLVIKHGKRTKIPKTLTQVTRSLGKSSKWWISQPRLMKVEGSH